MATLLQFPRRLVPFLAVTFLVAISAGAAAAQTKPKQDPPADAVPKFTVKGRVVFDDTDRPVRRAPISLIQTIDARPASSATDRDGRFVIEDVQPGVYFAFVNLPGIVTPLSFISFSENAPRDSLNVKAVREFCTEVIVDSSDVEVTVHARRGGAISGKVTYSDGDPAINAEIVVIRRTAGQPERVFAGFNVMSLVSPRTDDRGRYRISGLPPGEYIVSAAETSTAPKNKRSDYGHSYDMVFGSSDALVASYHGGVSRLDEAVKLKVEANSELSDIDIALADSTPHTLRGSVVAKLDRIPLPHATVIIDIKDRPAWSSRGVQQVSTDEQGQWTLEGVPDGTYVLRVQPPDGIPVPGATPKPVDPEEEEGPPDKPAPTRKFVSKETEVTVAGSDVVVDEFALPEGASISGTIEFPKPKGEDEYDARHVQVSWRYEGQTTSGYGNTTAGFGGVFSAEGLRAGKVYLNVTQGYDPQNSDGAYYAKSITLNGVDIRNKPITVTEGQSLTGVRIVMAENPAKASVKLVDTEGKPLVAKRIAIVSAQESRWFFQSETDVGLTDGRGLFAFVCPPGDYLVLVAAPDDFWPPNPEVIRQRSENAPRIKLAAGDNQTITITPR